MFSCIRLRKRQHCCKPKIGGETQITNKLSLESSKDQIQYGTIVLCDIAPTNSCHLLLRLAWLYFKTLNLDKGSLYLRDEGHEMKLKFMTPTQASKDQHRLKEKIEKEVLCDIAPTNSCHLLLRWAWLNFKTLNLDERSL